MIAKIITHSYRIVQVVIPLILKYNNDKLYNYVTSSSYQVNEYTVWDN